MPDRPTIDYLRISLTGRCNLRCCYCLAEGGLPVSRPADALTFDEIERLVRVFASLGGRVVRLTGGEPLLRGGLAGLVRRLSRIGGIAEICLTTNGVLLASAAAGLKAAGLSRINISLDTLRPERFSRIAGRDALAAVIAGIDAARRCGFTGTKLNMVVMRGRNDDEIGAFLDFARGRGLIPRFIEFMNVTPLWQERFFMPVEEIMARCRARGLFARSDFAGAGPAWYYSADGQTVGFIKTSLWNCRRCSRLRLTASGEVKACLYQPQGLRLGAMARRGESDAALAAALRALMTCKNDIDYSRWESRPAPMCAVGG